MSKKEIVAVRVGEDFRALSEEDKRRFVEDSLQVLLNMKPKQAKRLLERFAKRGRPSVKDLETINQLIIVFLYSLKTEFRYHYASMIYKMLKQPEPEDMPEKIDRIRSVKFIHMPIYPEVEEKLRRAFNELKITFDEENPESWNVFFNHALSTLEGKANK